MAFSMQIIFCCLILSSLVMMTTFAKPQIDIAESRLTVEEVATSNHIQELQVQIDELKQRKPQPPPGALISFNGQRLKANDDFKKIGKITYDMALTNIGNGLDLASGVFTAPLDGTYFFAFTAEPRGRAVVSIDSNITPNHLSSSHTGSGYVPLKCNTIVTLKKGDQVWVSLLEGAIYESDYQYTNFIGTLLG